MKEIWGTAQENFELIDKIFYTFDFLNLID